MRAIDPALQARLDTGATTLCRCWRLDRADGMSLGFTDHDAALRFDGLEFRADAALAGGALEQAAGAAADGVEVGGALRSDAISAEDIAAGLYAGARVRCWLVDWREPALRAPLFDGTIAEIEHGALGFRAELVGPAAGLNRPLGRAYLALCDATLGDGRCGVDLDAPGLSGEAVVLSETGEGRFEVAGLDVFGDGWFEGGRATWLSGRATGLAATVAADAAREGRRTLTLWPAPRPAVASGDRLRVSAGCDKRQETCRRKFGNFLNFRGFPHMPGDDWVTAHPAPGGVHDGGSRRG